MSNISTDDCKNFLINLYPQTQSKEWKRLSKHKNEEGLWIRNFVNTSHNLDISVLEKNGQLSVLNPSSSKDVFIIYRNDEEDEWGIYFGSALYPEDDDEEADDDIRDKLSPLNLEDMVMELENNNYQVITDNVKSLYDILVSNGFVYDKKLVDNQEYEVFDPKKKKYTQNAQDSGVTRMEGTIAIFHYIKVEAEKGLNNNNQKEVQRIVSELPSAELSKIITSANIFSFSPNSWVMKTIHDEKQDRDLNPHKPRNIVNYNSSEHIKRLLKIG